MFRAAQVLLLATSLLGSGIMAAGAAPLATSDNATELAQANPAVPLPESPLGISGKLSELSDPPTPETVRLGRWLFFDPPSQHRRHHLVRNLSSPGERLL